MRVCAHVCVHICFYVCCESDSCKMCVFKCTSVEPFLVTLAPLYHIRIMYASRTHHVHITYASCTHHVRIMYTSCTHHVCIMYAPLYHVRIPLQPTDSRQHRNGCSLHVCFVWLVSILAKSQNCRVGHISI